jgi:phenylalanyl-tRNA synthetase beta chain
MKVSLNSMQGLCRRYGCAESLVPEGIDTLLEKIGAQLGEIENVTFIKDMYAGATIVKVVACEDHPNADKLHVCTVDDGGKTANIDRQADGLIEVVFGAPNVHAGMLAVWLPPGSTVPESVGKEPFVLEARELRGVVSNGMLASPKELALNENHEGILEIEETAGVKPGDNFGTIFELADDVQIEIENKMFTHRPDCFGFLGIARELAGIQGLPFKSPDWYKTDAAIPAAETETLELELRNEIPSLVPRFMLVPMTGVKVGPSPVWLQVELAKYGIRSINNIVDYTNFFMLETGQPLHAYDYDKVKALSGGNGAIIEVRQPRDNERLKLLNGKDLDPRQEAIMIATDKALIGLGGVMGGADTEVSDTTTNIILECGTFDMYSVRRTSMEHGLFTEAVTRFNKGQSPLQNRAVMAKIVNEISQSAGGTVAGPVIDDNHVDGREWVHPPVPVTTAFINARLGFSLSPEDVKVILEHVEFEVAIDGDKLTITAPFWRTDIETREDVVEEVGRLYGYDKLPLELPKRSISPVRKNGLLELKSQIREKLVKSGANEVLTYSFVHGDLLDKVRQDKEKAFKLSNALSPDLQYYRVSLVPSLLDKVHMNIKAGYDAFALFELGKVHYREEWDEAEPEVPNEDDHVALVVAHSDKNSPEGAAYYLARNYLAEIMDTHEHDLVPMTEFDLESDEWGRQLAAPYEPGRSAVILQDKLIWGVVGEFRASVQRQLKLPRHTAGFEINTGLLGARRSAYHSLPRYPKVTQDITLKVPSETGYRKVFDVVWGEIDQARPKHSWATLGPLGIYQPEDNATHKNVSFRFSLASYEKTLTDSEVAGLLDTVATAAKDKLGAERV